MSIVAVCPYFRCDLEGKVRCECARLMFKDLTMRNRYIESYCASYDYIKCSVAKATSDHYERKGGNINENETYDRLI